MRITAAILLLLPLTSPAAAQSKDAAAQIKPDVEAIKQRIASVNALIAQIDEAVPAAGFKATLNRGGDAFYSMGDAVPGRDDVAKLERLRGELEKTHAEHPKACGDFSDKAQKLGFPWTGPSSPMWKLSSDCKALVFRLQDRRRKLGDLLDEWEKKRGGLDERDAKERAYQQAASGNDPRQRAVPLPPSLRLPDEPGSAGIDSLAVFADAHPSRFVFLRHDVKEGAPSPRQRPYPLQRTLRKGEAVLAVLGDNFDRDAIRVLTIDGILISLRTDDVAVAPIGRKPTALKAEDLVVYNDEGKAVGGPQWLRPDATGFALDDSGFLTLLDPPEPRTQQFIEAREKVRSCYRKQMDKLDPSGRYRRDYDVVTYSRDGVEKIESAARNFDRKACASCGCRKFNDFKRKLIKQAIAPAQKKAFERYRPVLDKLNATDFKKAAEGAPKGKIREAIQEL